MKAPVNTPVIKRRLKATSEVIELEPFGLTAGMDKNRPVMLFREKGGEAVLPVWLTALDAGIAITQNNAQAFALSPHDITLHVLTSLGVRPTICHFKELRGHQQYVELQFAGSKKLKFIEARADHAISFCLQAKMQFYCTRGFIERCRDVEAEMSHSRTSPDREGHWRRSRHPYLN